jgi:hypothetical protein
MIQLPNQENTESTQALPEGPHVVTIRKIKMVTTGSGEDKLVVEYENTTGDFTDWLGFKSAAQGKRTYAYICRLHELAGADVPKGGKFDEAALVGTEVAINLIKNDAGYMNLADFPSSAQETPF